MLAGVLLLLFALFLPIFFHTPFIHMLSTICGLTGVVLYLGGRLARFRRYSMMGRIRQKPGWVSGFRAFTIILLAIILPVVILWIYLKVRSRR